LLVGEDSEAASRIVEIATPANAKSFADNPDVAKCTWIAQWRKRLEAVHHSGQIDHIGATALPNDAQNVRLAPHSSYGSEFPQVFHQVVSLNSKPVPDTHQVVPVLGNPIENTATKPRRQSASQEFAILDPDQRRMTAAIDMHMGRVVVTVEHLDLEPADHCKRRHRHLSADGNIEQILRHFKISDADFAMSIYEEN
jgi:hypothetical protein